jgi:hypothetical protein
MWQVPPAHDGVAPVQAFVHDPQCMGSVLTSTHEPSHVIPTQDASIACAWSASGASLPWWFAPHAAHAPKAA